MLSILHLSHGTLRIERANICIDYLHCCLSRPLWALFIVGPFQ
jgi:hypothetical protein